MERMGLEPGTEIGGYTVVAPLGSGGMGTVYRAVDGGGDAVALKMLHPHIGSDAVARDRLRREVHALQKLRHPGVAAILDAEADSTEAFLVTELVTGDNLEEHVRERGTLDAEQLLDLAEGLRDALVAVHGAGVVHRDLKPSNVIVGDDGPVLIDFGIAQAADDSKLTAEGMVLGTPGYLAPELLDGDEPDEASDFWGWAAILAFAATGRDPFGTRPLEAVLARARSGDVDLAGLGPLTTAALRRALAPVAADRTSPDDVLAALTVVVAEGESIADETDTAVLVADDLVGTTVLAPEPATVAVAASAVPPAVANDGHTRAFDPTALEPVGADEEWDEDPEDPDGVDWINDDLDASEEPEPEGSGYERPPARRRWGTLLAAALLLGSAGALYPGVTLIVFAVLVVVVRTVGSTVEAMYGRRERAGVRRSDRAVAAATLPWHLLRSLVGLIPSLVVGASVVVILLGLSWWLIGDGRWVIGDSPSGQEPQGLTAAILVGSIVLIGAAVVWWGPLSLMTRIGARRVLAVVAPGRTGALVATVVLLAASAVFLAQIFSGSEITWAPLPTPVLP
ncbi:serine/threonine-protein kinase [Cellulomonas sp. Root137]|uniref:serine/threonine-protein kinase n=1 Tax=Cellulomonas sp. Root137 TaxID=1736459 RepID=UPI0006F5C66B|nr:serine/threonine-protein kinase [Cellulomonas sp. Root137]KQY46002.1 serine/threonine protein kinase [Cellulomonas sp. Root137]